MSWLAAIAPTCLLKSARRSRGDKGKYIDRLWRRRPGRRTKLTQSCLFQCLLTILELMMEGKMYSMDFVQHTHYIFIAKLIINPIGNSFWIVLPRAPHLCKFVITSLGVLICRIFWLLLFPLPVPPALSWFPSPPRASASAASLNDVDGLFRLNVDWER